MKKPFLVLLMGLVAASCVPSTPQTRIQQRPEVFAALTANERALVQRGELAKGMSPDAVMLAWGAPALQYKGYHQDRPAMRWDYTGARAVYSGPYYGMYGYGGYGGYGYHGRYGYSTYGFGFAPELAYVPYRRASVWFVNHRVDAWDRLR